MKKLLCIAIALFLFLGTAIAESQTVWVLCQPGSYVNIRLKASGRSDIVGYADCGEAFDTDGISKNGFLHVYASIENGEGWISKGYLVYEKPIYIGRKMTITSKGRVNARRTINGKRRCWVKPGEIVAVYWSAEWAVTSKGFIRTEFLAD